MRVMIKISLLISVLVFMAVSAWALPIGVGDRLMVDQMAYNNGTSDRFLLHDLSTGDSYNAFCLEKDIYFEWEEMRVQSIGNEVISGGINYGVGGGNGGDPISQETIWLYASYWDGDFGNLHTSKLMMQVQNAIWFKEDEYDAGKSAFDTLITLNGPAISDFSVTGWDIQAVNPVNAQGNEMQSLLVGAPVPEPATMLLFGTGLVSLAVSRLRQKRVT